MIRNGPSEVTTYGHLPEHSTSTEGRKEGRKEARGRRDSDATSAPLQKIDDGSLKKCERRRKSVDCESSEMAPAAAAGADGYWGVPTATIDWCEENYQVIDY